MQRKLVHDTTGELTVDAGRSYRHVVIKRCAIISVILIDAIDRILLQAFSNLAERENSPSRLKDISPF